MRRFFIFNNCADVSTHVSQIKTTRDLAQLHADILAAGCNLTKFHEGVPGVWAVDCAERRRTQRHVFMTKRTYERLNPTPEDREKMTTLTILES